MTDTTSATPTPRVTRLRHELKRRSLTITRTERLTPKMIRLTLEGADLAGFVSASPDDHVKLFVPGGEDMAMRDYTPRRHKDGQLLIDVFDHAGGPAADWARDARAGDSAMVGGPRGSAVVEGEIDHWLLIGDETALPAIGRRVEELPAGVSVTTVVTVQGPEEEQQFDTDADWTAHWVHRPEGAAADAAPFLEALAGVTLPPRSYVWVGAEAGVARAIRQEIMARGVQPGWLKAAGYWIAGKADASVKSLED
ncbi:siderophore-interacting protein [uncultured Salipiger sp.]|uniref:siderophore-interacting protein n=1 Tax=uncultured Salipiger sp. TaxID=499810 RepID=UPI0025977A34|nr:siderophore-interacting protein [uncultured Salipiger sp.]